MKKLLTMLSVFALSACATTTTGTIAESNGRVSLADSHIGEDYDSVMARATTGYSVEPQCEQRRVSLNKQRKAFPYEICGFTPESKQFSAAPLSEVVYHFIEKELVRVDVRAQGDAALLDSVKQDMALVFGSNKAVQSTLGKDSYQWNAKQHVAGVRVGGGANAGNVHIRLLDETLIDSAPWLAEE